VTAYGGVVSENICSEARLNSDVFCAVPAMIDTLPMIEGDAAMNWEEPSFTEVKMDSEINSYQDDFRDVPDANEGSKAMPIITTRQE
jgi:hypothetical protein